MILVDLLDVLVEGRQLPAGYDSWAIKSVRPDLCTRNGFRWPFPGNETRRFELDDHDDSCPQRVDDGLCVAKTWAGMASGGFPARTLLLVAYRAGEARGSEPGKLRVPQCFVADVVDGEQLLIAHGARADLVGAYLPGVNLTRANLPGVNLTRADLTRAYLPDANLTRANLTRANLEGADLTRANLTRANLEGADLTRADLTRANLEGAYLEGANLDEVEE